jgi:hypothetical protein
MNGLDVGGGTFGGGVSKAWVYDTTITGGSAQFLGGGHGLVVEEMSQVDLLGATLAGGAGSPAGQGSLVVSGTVTSHPEAPRSMSVLSPNRAHGHVTIEHRGLPGDSVWDLFAPAPEGAVVESPSWVGPLVVPQTAEILHIGNLPASGTSAENVLLCHLESGVGARICFDQPFLRDAATQRFVAGSPTLVLHLPREKRAAGTRDRAPEAPGSLGD